MSMAAIGVAAAGAAVSAGASYGLSQMNKPKAPGANGYAGSPAQAQPLDYNYLMQQANANAAKQVEQQFQAQNNYYGATQGLQLGTIGSLAGNLNNGYTANANNAASQSLAQAQNLWGLGNITSQYGQSQLANSGPNSLESNLYNQANSNLALGSSLDPQDARQATQQAMTSYAGSGLGNSAGAAATGILDRYQLGQQRLAQRQAAAVQADNTYTQNPLARYGAGMGALGQAGSLYGNAGSLYNQGANTQIAIDPYQRSLGVGALLAGQNLGNSAGIIGNTYAGADQMVGNIASFNANLQQSQYNAYQNNQAALNGYQSAANGQLWGAGLGAASNIGSAYLQSQALNGWGSGTGTAGNAALMHQSQAAAAGQLGFTPTMASFKSY